MKRTHRKLLVLNYIVSPRNEMWYYCEYSYLKKILTRNELIELVNNVRLNKNFLKTSKFEIQGV